MKKLSRKKLIEKLQETLSNKDFSNLDKLMLSSCLIQKNFQMRQIDYNKLLQPETFDCFSTKTT